MRLRPLLRNDAWSFGFVQAQTRDGQSLRILTLIAALADSLCLQGISEHIRRDDGPEMIAKAPRQAVAPVGAQIQTSPRSPWESGGLTRA